MHGAGVNDAAPALEGMGRTGVRLGVRSGGTQDTGRQLVQVQLSRVTQRGGGSSYGVEGCQGPDKVGARLREAHEACAAPAPVCREAG